MCPVCVLTALRHTRAFLFVFFRPVWQTLDASIYRSGNSTLSVTKNLNVEGVLTVDGQNVYKCVAPTTITA